MLHDSLESPQIHMNQCDTTVIINYLQGKGYKVFVENENKKQNRLFFVSSENCSIDSLKKDLANLGKYIDQKFLLVATNQKAAYVICVAMPDDSTVTSIVWDDLLELQEASKPDTRNGKWAQSALVKDVDQETQ